MGGGLSSPMYGANYFNEKLKDAVILSSPMYGANNFCQ